MVKDVYETEKINTNEGKILIAFVGIDNDTFDNICHRFHKRVGYALLKVDSLEHIEELGYQPEMLLLDEGLNLDKLPTIPHATITKFTGQDGSNSYSSSNEINPATGNSFIEDTIESIIGQTLSIRYYKLLDFYKDKIADLVNKINNPNEVLATKNELLSLFADKDETTYNHTTGVMELVEPMCVGMELIGIPLSSADINTLNKVALIHDIGKLSIPDQLIKNNDNFSKNEFEIMKKHIGANLTLAISDHAQEIYSLAMKHHYKFGGNGYPDQEIIGNDIPLISRMMTVIDSFEAMTSKDRTYQEIMPLEKAFDILYNNSQPQTDFNKFGGQFDPNCAIAFLNGFKNKFETDPKFQQKWLERENITINSSNYFERTTQIIESLDSTIAKFEIKDDKKQV